MKLKVMETAMANTKKIDALDTVKMAETLRTNRVPQPAFDERMKMEAMRIVTKHLDEFSKTLDKRLPNLATKDEIAAFEVKLDSKIDKKLRSLRPMNTDPMLAKRMENIEKAIKDMSFMLKSMTSTHPFIVE